MNKMRMPKSVKAWTLKVDKAERELCKQNKVPYRKISNGLLWKDDVLVVSGCAQVEMRDKKNLYDEFPSEYKYTLA